jgi:hypothetical protein
MCAKIKNKRFSFNLRVHGCSKSAFLLNANEELFLAQDTHLLLKRIENIFTLENVDKLCGFVAKIREILQTPVMLSVVSFKTCGRRPQRKRSSAPLSSF